ncbi:helix-turn-helix domain-containing protein [Phyllobacterium sp. YR531]|uniref:helix-turn-helix domain-containing protein n=1 Tax=Phyllobacterium sp. YR531 TaxID=1144343 RepID=UPI00026F49CD|nr:helix-turn-helix domain-containing protein [Phyllobacterium sp. YR531]EJN02454.1 transcriptional regulator containing an amidase domain and an AraC-type DNA-binding HTH domain [Phyllobacterium sp. YR531]
MASEEPSYSEITQFDTPYPNNSSHTVNGDYNTLDIAEAFIKANITNPVVASDIAAAAGVNIRALQRLFRKAYASTPTQVLLSTRVAVAREMILRGEARSVRQIAATLQFSNPSRFSKLYRKIYAHIPSQEIRERQTGDDGTMQD